MLARNLVAWWRSIHVAGDQAEADACTKSVFAMVHAFWIIFSFFLKKASRKLHLYQFFKKLTFSIGLLLFFASALAFELIQSAGDRAEAY